LTFSNIPNLDGQVVGKQRDTSPGTVRGQPHRRNTCRPFEWGTVQVSMEMLSSDNYSDSDSYRAPSGIVKNSLKFKI
jgi:hypothetical protein